MEDNSRIWKQYRTSLIAAVLGGFSLGTITGWISPAILELAKQYKILQTDNRISLLGSLAFLGASVAILGPIELLLRKFGRKKTMLILLAPLIIGWLTIIAAPTITYLFVGRFLTGFSAGGFCIVTPAFISGISDPHIRGELTILYPLMLTIGIAFSFIVGGLVSMQALHISCVVIASIFGIAFYFDKSDSGQILKTTPSTIWEFDPKVVRKSLLIVCGSMILQQFTGMTAIMSYFRLIFEDSYSSEWLTYILVLLGIIQIIGNVFGLMLIEKYGRKFLYYVSSVIMAVTLLMMAVYFQFGLRLSEIILLPTIVLYVFGYCIGACVVPWVLMGEIFPPKLDSIGASCTVFTNLFTAFLTTYVFVHLLSSVGRAGTFYLLSLGAALFLPFARFILIETKGKPLEQIQNELAQ